MKTKVREYSRQHFLIILLHFTMTMIILLLKLFTSVVAEWWKYDIMILLISYQLYAPYHHIGSLKLAMGIFTPWKLAKATNQDPFSSLENQLLNMY